MKKQPLLTTYKDLIAILAKITYKKRKELISVFNKSHINTLSEIFKNFLNKNLTVNPVILKKLKKYYSEIRCLACKKPGITKKKNILLSRRGGNLLSIVLPLALQVISKLLP